MTGMTDQQIAALIAALAALWPHAKAAPVSKQVEIRVWGKVLEGLGHDECLEALVNASKEGREFPPPVGALRQLVVQARQSTPDVDEALAEAYRQAQAVGRLGRPTWSHPAIAAAIAALGGWSEFCNSENPEALRAHFRQAYTSAAERANREQAAAPPPPPGQPALGPANPLELPS